MTTWTRLLLLSAGSGVVFLACKSPTPPPPGASGAEIFELQLCANCHKEDGSGGWLGPPLRDLGRHWDREDLARFLAAPSDWNEDDRLAGLRQSFSSEMSSYDNLSEEERLRLADHLLGW